MRSIKSLAGALAGSLALAGVTALGAAAPAAAITPQEALVAPGFGGYSSGEIVHAEAVGTTDAELTRAELAQSSAGLGVDQGLVDVDTLDSRILFADQTGKNAYGHGVGLSTSVGQAPGSVPQVTLAVAEALSPPPSTDEDTVLEVPADPLVTADVLAASALANTTTVATACLPEAATLLSEGQARATNAALLEPADVGSVATEPVIVLGGTSESISRNELVPLGGGIFGLTTFTTQTVAPLTLLGGTELETRIEVLQDIQLRATATGADGGSDVFFGFVRADGTPVADTTPVLRLTVANSEPVELTSQQVLGGEGLRLQLGVIDVVIGGPANEIVEAPDGTAAFGTADFIRITSPGTVPTGTDPVLADGPLAPIGDVLDPLIDGLAAITDPIQDALIEAGITAADIRLLHLEALATVPDGGIICGPDIPGDDEDPLRNAFKDVSSLGVAPGATFDYTVRFPNDGSTPLTNVRVVDTFTGGPPPLEFISSDPAPTSREGNTLTYEIGTIQPGTFRDISFTFRVPADAPVGTRYMNRATITATFEGRQIEKVVNIDAPTVIAAPTGPCAVDRSTKFASNTEVRTGQEFAYFINVSNTGGAECTGVTVTDDLVQGVTFVSCSDNCTNEGQRVTFSVGTLTSGASKTLRITVRVTATSGTLPNAADITTDQGARARPATDGPRITDNSVGRPGAPAGCPATGCPAARGAGRQLPETGLGTTAPLLGVVALMLTMAIRRRRGDLTG
jgi:uncharacterized repeat protein (TIGR01451 family)